MPYALEDLVVSQTRLTNFTRRMGSNPEDFAALQVAPIFPADRPLGSYTTFNRDDERLVPNALRAPGDAPHKVSLATSTATYEAHEYALEMEINDEERMFNEGDLDPEADVTAALTRLKDIDIESRFVNLIDATTDHHASNSSTKSGASQWSAYATSTPLLDVATAQNAIISKIGRKPNLGVMSYEVFNKLQFHPDFKEVIKHVGLGRAVATKMAEMFDLEELIIAKAIYNTAKEGATDSISYMWGKDMYLFAVERAPTKRSVTFGWHFARPFPGGGNDRMPAVEIHRADERLKKDIIVLRYSGTFNAVAMSAGASYFIEDAVA